MPPSPQHFNSLAVKYLLHLALWHRRASPEHEGDSSEPGRFARLWLQHGCDVSFGIAVEQLAMSSG
eukprot:4839074-Amphidinium_carterae.1